MALKINWSKAETLAQTRSILREILDNKDVYLIGQVLEKKEYSLDSWRSAVYKWESCAGKNDIATAKRLHDYKEKIYSTLEDRLALAGLLNKCNASITQFVLKNRHGWKDKQELETTNTNLELSKLFDAMQSGGNSYGLLEASKDTLGGYITINKKQENTEDSATPIPPSTGGPSQPYTSPLNHP